MPYDSSLDAEVFSKFIETEDGKISVSVHSYKNGPKKVQIVREVKDKEGGFTFTKLGRLSKQELTQILPLLNEAMAVM